MRHVWLLAAGVLTLVLIGPVGTGPVYAQDDEAEAADADADVAADADVGEDEDLLGEDELDELVAPVALYPDSLLTQVLVASTYPLDVVKAERFVEDNADPPEADRSGLAEAEDWDPSVQVLAAGFPTVVERMADEIDWTEQLGDAMLIQTDDLLDAIQRMRERAVATGYLADNEAQVVEQEDDLISIEPADPEVVYVPSYDSTAAFTTAPTAAPVVYATEDSGWDAGDVLTTGAIAFGGAMILDEIFDDDDDWDDYWRGPRPIDWDDGDFYPGRGVNVDGDVNIDRGDREINVDRDIDRDRVRNNVDIDRDRTKIGDIDRDNIDIGKEGAWKPSDDRKRQARDKVADRKRDGDGAKTKAAKEKLAAHGGGDSGAREKLAHAKDKRKPEAKKPGKKDTALKKPDKAGKPKVNKDKARAAKSIDKKKASSAAKSRPKAAQAKPKQKISKSS
jgi:hypothetical protein